MLYLFLRLREKTLLKFLYENREKRDSIVLEIFYNFCVLLSLISLLIVSVLIVIVHS